MIVSHVNWGLIGPGAIAEKFARDIRLVSKARLVSVASSDPLRARSFGERFKVSKVADSYSQLLNDPGIDAVYIATIHPTHYPIAKDALMAGKHVLIEKPLTMNAEQAKALVSLARSRGLFLMEAMWTAFLPVTQAVRGLIESKAIGPIQRLEGSFCISTAEESAKRLYDPALGGGALLDLGVYPLSYAHMIMGSGYSAVSSAMTFTSKGVDRRTEIRLTYREGVMAALSCDMDSQTPISFKIYGDSGTIEVPHFLGATTYLLHRADGDTEQYSLPFRGEGFVEQIDASSEAIMNGQQESSLWPHQDTLSVLELMDTVRRANALHYGSLEST